MMGSLCAARRLFNSAALSLAISISIPACFQIKQKNEQFDVTESVYLPAVLTDLQNGDGILVGGIEAEEFSINAESATQLVEAIVLQWRKAGYSQVKTAYKPWAELGIKAYNEFARSLDFHRPLSIAMREHYLQFGRQSKYLLYVTIQSQLTKELESAVSYSKTQAITVNYRIWELAQGEVVLDVKVQGFSYARNEKHVSTQSNLGKNLLEDTIYFIAYDGMPIGMSLTDHIEKTTGLFIQRLEKLRAGNK